MGDVAEKFKAFWAKPFDANGNAIQWFLFFGLLILISFAWSRILKFITE